MPKEVFPQQVRTRMAAHGSFPKYRLTGVIYHHGKNANGGHYTVDLRRQDGNEWIRLDDTLIRRIRSEDVAEGGSEENPKVLAAALERHKQQKATGNRFEQIEQDEDDEDNAPRKLGIRSTATRELNLQSALSSMAPLHRPRTRQASLHPVKNHR